MNFSNTDEQTAILEAVTSSKENLIIQALAGCAKTTTLGLIARSLPSVETYAIAFNAAIVEELREKLPSDVEVLTINSLGHRAIGTYLKKKPNLDKSKIYGLTKKICGLFNFPDEFYKENFNDLLTSINMAKQLGYMPPSPTASYRPLMTRDDFHDYIALSEHSEEEIEIIDKVLLESYASALRGYIDFGDQVLLPAIMQLPLPTPALTLVDEAQDLSPCNHYVLQKLVRNRRIIAVGDSCQAIYGFRGAEATSMSLLQGRFKMKELRLTVNFRSGTEIVENAKWRAPLFQARPDAPKGEVLYLANWTPSTIQPNSVILCRNNAPLFSAAVRLLKAGRAPEFVGKDVVQRLLKIMRSLGKPAMSAGQAIENLNTWKEKRDDKSREQGVVKDQYECCLVFLRAATKLSDACDTLEALADRPGDFKLMTAHKAKGLEFDTVYFLDAKLCKDEGQDRNIRYVIETRARDSLQYITSKTYTG